MWIVVVLLPFVFSALAYGAASGRLPPSTVAFSALSAAVLECVFLATRPGSWSLSSVAFACALTVLAPWLVAFCFAWLVPLRRAPRIWAAATPAVYGLALAVGVIVADASGWIGQ